MFIFNLTYMKPISQVEQFLPEHVFVCSGRKIPRTGGIILCNCSSKEESEAIMKKDPFYREKIAKYEIIEFVPSKWSDLIQPCLIR